MSKILMITLVFSFTLAAKQESLEFVRNCIYSELNKLSDRESIVSAVLDDQTEIIDLFGKAKKDQIFEIGSITKTFTASLLAQLILGKKIRIDSFIPDDYQKKYFNKITYEHLVTHTSGIIAGIFPEYRGPDPLRPYLGLDLDTFKHMYENTPLESEPGMKFRYSNMGSSLLGILITELYDESYETLVKEKIFRPLKMNNSYFKVPNEKMKHFPLGHIVLNNEVKKTPHWELHETAINPAGGIRSTISDMVKYARANLSSDSTSISRSLSYTHTPLYTLEHNRKIAMKWIVEPDDGVIWHNGGTYGFNSVLVVSKKKNFAVIAMTNTNIVITDENGKSKFDSGLQDAVFECL